MSRTVSVLAFIAGTTMLAGAANAQKTVLSKDGRWQGVSEIVGQTPTSLIAGAGGGGDPIYIPTPGKYAGTVGLLMDYGAGGAFVCSGTLINSNTIVTAAHCVSDGTPARPLTTTAFFHNGPDGPTVYNPALSGSVARNVVQTVVHSGYSGEVVDENDIAILTLGEAAPDFAKAVKLSAISDLTGLDHTIAGYGARSADGGTNGTLTGFGANTGRLRDADNRFDWRFGDADFEGYWDGAFGPQGIDNVWMSDFDNGTAFRDNSCNLAGFEAANAPAIFSKAVFSSSKYCDLGRGAREGIGAGGDSGTGYFIDGELVAVHSFALWYRADESANRFGQFKGAVSVDFHRDFINANVPEPATWAMMIAGFGLVGGAVRRSRTVRTAVSFA
jgi:V8-like Glu-specific endopeptidase